MQKISLCVLLIAYPLIQANGQRKSDFNIKIPEITIENSYYNTLEYIESRPNPNDMGSVYINSWIGFEEVTLSEPLDQQLHSLIKSVTSQTEDNNKIAVQMRVLFFDSGTENHRGKGKCNLRMTLYKMDNENTFYFLNTIDTLIIGDKKEIRNLSGSTIVSFITDNLPCPPYENEEALMIEQVMDIDFYEKNGIPFYTKNELPDGIYSTYSSLKHLIPDEVPELTEIDTDKEMIKDIKIPDMKKPGKTKKIKAEDIYAFVSDGIPYIGYNGVFHKAYKKDGDWRFIVSQTTADSGFSLSIGIGGSNHHATGGVGIGIPIGGKKENYEIFIDQLNGDFYWGGKVSK